VHELVVTESVLQIALESAAGADARKVVGIDLLIGDLSTFVDDSVQFYFEMLSKGTIAQGARLNFRRIPARLRCRDCGREFLPGAGEWLCPHCGAIGGDVIAGREFRVESIDVE
jgi:hydrogenase nickel incorporation protein HypA/HybF